MTTDWLMDDDLSDKTILGNAMFINLKQNSDKAVVYLAAGWTAQKAVMNQIILMLLHHFLEF